MRHRVAPAPGRARVRTVLLAALPWAWFPLRDLLGVAGDTVAIALPVLVGLAVAVALLVRRRRALVPALSLLLAGAVAVALPWSPADAGAVSGGGVTVAAANITSRTATLPALRAVAADVLVVSENTLDVDAGLAETYPHRVVTPGLLTAGSPAIGVYSRFPLRLLEPPGPDLPGLRVAVDAPTPFVLHALHVPRPWWTSEGTYQVTVAEHHRLVVAAAERVARERGPVVVAGDLNSTDRARDYRLLTGGTGLSDAMRDGWTGPTSVTKWWVFLLRLDHLLVGPGWCGDAARHVTLPGSDHDGVTATVGPCARAGG